VLADGTELIAVSFGGADPYARENPPDFGLYLDERWRPPWSYAFLDWPDFGVPDDPVLVLEALETLLDRARAGQRVEIGCYGGHGRTGTALACLAILCGQSQGEAVEWVRTAYCERAVETAEQEAFARNFPS
jgi:protein-tyrosine phosphatase